MKAFVNGIDWKHLKSRKLVLAKVLIHNRRHFIFDIILNNVRFKAVQSREVQSEDNYPSELSYYIS